VRQTQFLRLAVLYLLVYVIIFILNPILGSSYYRFMRILSRSTLRVFWETHPDAEEALKTWYFEASHAKWQSPVDIKTAHRNASIIANNRVVFNIKGNTYRLIVSIRYDIGIIFIRFVGTHSEYDKVDAKTV
jgi:mRNA interferase HigB